MRILVVDDYPGAAEMSCTLLRLMGHEALSATNGRDALDQATVFDPHIVVLDLGLPDLNGYEVARHLRARHGRRPYIAAVTGRATTDDRVQSLAAGIDMHIVKPTSGDKLATVIEAAVRFSGSAGSDPA